MVINEHGIKYKIMFTVAGGTSLNRGVDHFGSYMDQFWSFTPHAIIEYISEWL